MARLKNPNLLILSHAAERLGELSHDMVFLGGCATGLLITDLAAPPVRMTHDVDAIVQVSTRADYYQLSERLRTNGFQEDTSEGAPLCRWQAGDVILDVMPTDSRILGFSNQWYPDAMDHAQTVTLDSGHVIRMVTGPYFLITKLEAFDGRGGGDYLSSHDMEDIISVIDGRPSIVEEVKRADPELQRALSMRLNGLLSDERFIVAVSGHMPTDQTSQARVPIILERLNALV